MPTDSLAISSLAKSIATTAEQIANDTSSTKEQLASLVASAEKLAIAAREPEENVYYIATQIAQNAAIRSIIAMGVFDEMPLDGSPISVETLAARLKVDKDLLARFLRACASTHFFDEPAPLHYAHNALSRAYTRPENRAMTAQMYDFTCKGVFAIPEFGRQNGWKNAGNYKNGPFQLGANTQLGFWEYLQAVPERMQLFNAGMRAGTTIGSGKRSGVFPFGDILNQFPCKDGDDIAVVDVGGGRGQSLEAIHEDYPEIQGRLILQDLPHVIADGKTKGLPSFIETDMGSFFEPQTVKGARIYYFRRIFHDWDQEQSKIILENTRAGMDSRSRVVIADMALPDQWAPRDMALQDLNMMSFGGMERTETQWKQLIESAGLVLKKIWQGEAGAKHSVIEAVLPEYEGF